MAPSFAVGADKITLEKDVLDSLWQYQIPLWLVFFLFLITLVVPMEVGFRLGERQHRLHPDGKNSPQ